MSVMTQPFKQLFVLKIMSHCAGPIKSAEFGLCPISDKHENLQIEKCSEINEFILFPILLASTLYEWRRHSKQPKKFDDGKGAHVLLRGRPSGSKDTATEESLE